MKSSVRPDFFHLLWARFVSVIDYRQSCLKPGRDRAGSGGDRRLAVLPMSRGSVIRPSDCTVDAHVDFGDRMSIAVTIVDTKESPYIKCKAHSSGRAISTLGSQICDTSHPRSSLAQQAALQVSVRSRFKQCGKRCAPQHIILRLTKVLARDREYAKRIRKTKMEFKRSRQTKHNIFVGQTNFSVCLPLSVDSSATKQTISNQALDRSRTQAIKHSHLVNESSTDSMLEFDRLCTSPRLPQPFLFFSFHFWLFLQAQVLPCDQRNPLIFPYDVRLFVAPQITLKPMYAARSCWTLRPIPQTRTIRKGTTGFCASFAASGVPSLPSMPKQLLFRALLHHSLQRSDRFILSLPRIRHCPFVLSYLRSNFYLTLVIAFLASKAFALLLYANPAKQAAAAGAKLTFSPRLPLQLPVPRNVGKVALFTRYTSTFALFSNSKRPRASSTLRCFELENRFGKLARSKPNESKHPTRPLHLGGNLAHEARRSSLNCRTPFVLNSL
ncbi:hypothetical protein KC353_g9 [Hortaea werneckii]|nr:hypothetical protein KC353_g9 [Hortaea werneckii]